MRQNLHCLLLVYFSALLLPVIVSAVPFQESPTLFTQDEKDDVTNKRAWKDVSGSWGKRGWNDLEGTWGKRAWERMNGAWGKRLTLQPEASAESEREDDLLSKIIKRPEWNKFKGSWGKRVPEGDKSGWSNLKGLWGKKRTWENLGNSWGKRPNPESTRNKPSGQHTADNLLEVSVG